MKSICTLEFKLAYRIHTDMSIRLRNVFVFFVMVINLNTAKGHPTDQYPVFIKPVPARLRPVTIFKQPDFQSSLEEAQRAYDCAILPCDDEVKDVLCACNFNTGNVVTFKNGCDLKKHNCRFFTDFRAILGQICPWEFQTRRKNTGLELVIDYSNPKYYN